jgi:hypothetical protein
MRVRVLRGPGRAVLRLLGEALTADENHEGADVEDGPPVLIEQREAELPR